ncbi:MAG: Hsp20/alpha crystallin family protein [Oscillospiraceae bacterium]|jgi:HSP20 family protein|nr:Hsp20/alpha crystallin family protein [Oscillospiraceae bacterium]
MYTLTRYNNPLPRRNAYWPFTEVFFRPFAEMMNSPMRTSVKETEDAYLFDAELPGFEPQEIDLTVQDGVLTIAAEHKEGDDKQGETAYVARSVRRSFTVEGIDEAHIEAQYKNGILRVTLPKFKEAAPAPRKIDIQ